MISDSMIVSTECIHGKFTKEKEQNYYGVDIPTINSHIFTRLTQD